MVVWMQKTVKNTMQFCISHQAFLPLLCNFISTNRRYSFRGLHTSDLRVFVTLLLILLLKLSLNGQAIQPKDGFVFMQEQVSKVEIFIHPDSLAIILEPGNESSNHEFPATFIYSVGNYFDTVYDIGFRLRGNTSRYSGKKSFKISFNTFSNQKFHDLEKLNLNGEHNDPSIARTRLFWKIAQDFGIPASRVNHTRFFINGEYRGLYVNVEHIDEEFVQIRYGNKNGNLYKCLWPADLAFISNNPESYKLEENGRRVYELKTNTETDNYSDLAHFIDVINNTPINELQAELEPIFNIDAFLKYYAFEILSGHWDGYAYNMNNFYLYNNSSTGKFEFIPYDGDNTFGIDWIGRDWANRDINNWARNNWDRPLVKRILQVAEYKNRLNFFLNQLLDQSFLPAIVYPQIDAIKSQISAFVTSDTYYSNSYGYNYQSFNNSYTQGLGGHVAYGLKPYFTSRYNSAKLQLQLQDISPIISSIQWNQVLSGQLAWVRCLVEDEDEAIQVDLHYRFDSSNWDFVAMSDNGAYSDEEPGDGIYGIYLNTDGGSGSIDFYLMAEDQAGNTTRQPIEGHFNMQIKEEPAYTLSINEFCASNQNLALDNFGDYDDWLELHNYGQEAIFLNDFYLSNDTTLIKKWRLPAIWLQPGQYEICWMDNQTNQGIWHANFKLNRIKGSIILSYAYDTIYNLTDLIHYGYQFEDEVSGRYPNGIGPIQYLPIATPGFSNLSYTNDIAENQNKPVKAYPNPFSENIQIEFPYVQNAQVKIYDLQGRTILGQTHTGANFIWNGRNASGTSSQAGIYFFQIISAEGKHFGTTLLKQ